MVAKDRGYTTEEGIVFAIGKYLGLSRVTVKYALYTGRFSWEQILCIGSFFEMSPREFCDVFLSGFFIEDDLGHYKCHVDNVEMILHPPKTKDGVTKAMRAEAERERILEDLENV